MEVKAVLRYYRKSARKVKPVIDLIRGLPVSAAEAQLMFVKREPAQVVLKLLKSAVANAVNNNKLDASTLFVKEVTANQGPTIKRTDPRAMGRAYTIRKRTSHLTVVVSNGVVEPVVAVQSKSEKQEAVKASNNAKKTETKEVKTEGKAEAKEVKAKKAPATKKPSAKKN